MTRDGTGLRAAGAQVTADRSYSLSGERRVTNVKELLLEKLQEKLNSSLGLHPKSQDTKWQC